MGRFNEDLKHGDKSEEFITNFFREGGYTCEFNTALKEPFDAYTGKAREEWLSRMATHDLWVSLQDRIAYFEGKRDQMNEIPQRYAIEYRWRGELSGIQKTKSHVWIHLDIDFAFFMQMTYLRKLCR